MLSFTGSLKVLVALEPCDMCKGFEGLHAAVSERLEEDVRSGALFVVTNKRHSQLTVLADGRVLKSNRRAQDLNPHSNPP